MANLTIEVTPSVLEQKSEALKSVATKIQNLTTEIGAEMTSLKSAWTGTAADAYVAKFDKLKDNFQGKYDTINAYSKFLSSAATEFKATEDKNAQLSETIK